MTIPPERRTNAVQTRSSALVEGSTGGRLRAVVEGLVLAALSLVAYVYAIYPLSVAFTPLGAGSPANLVVLVATVVVLSVVYDLLRASVG